MTDQHDVLNTAANLNLTWIERKSDDDSFYIQITQDKEYVKAQLDKLGATYPLRMIHAQGRVFAHLQENLDETVAERDIKIYNYFKSKTTWWLKEFLPELLHHEYTDGYLSKWFLLPGERYTPNEGDEWRCVQLPIVKLKMNMWLDGYYFQNMESGITHAVKRPILLSFHTIGKFGDDIMKIMKKELESGIEQLDNPVMIKEAITTIPKIWSELGQGLKQKYEDQVDVKDIIKIIGKYEPQIKAEHLRALEAERLQRENISASIGIQNLLKRANVGNLYTPPLIQQRRSRLVFDYAPAVAAPAVAAPAVAAPATPIPKSAELKEFERLRKLGQLLEYELRDLNIFKYLTECHKSKNATGLPMPCNLVDWVIWTWDIEGRGYQGAEDELDYLEQKYFLSKDAKNKIFFSENETERLHELRAAKSEKSSAPEEQLGGQGNAPVPGAPVSWRELGKSIGKSGIAPIQTQGSDDDLRKMIAALEDGDNDLAASIFNSRFSKYKLSLIPKLQEALKSKNSSRVERVLNEESKARRLDNLVPKLVEELMEGGREGALGLLGEERYKQEVEKILPEILDQVEEGDITGAHKTLTRHMRRLRQLDHRKRGGKRSEKRGIFGGGIFGSSGGGGSDGGGGGVSTGVSIRSISFQPQERQWNRRHH